MITVTETVVLTWTLESKRNMPDATDVEDRAEDIRDTIMDGIGYPDGVELEVKVQEIKIDGLS